MTAVALEPSAAVQVRRGVPWKTVLSLGIVMALADGYWMTTLRGAVGAIARTQGPFASWLRESLLSVPLFLLAVLAGVTLAMRLFGPARGTWRTVVATILIVAAAGTLAGIAELAVSSGYDYILQTHQLQRMDAIHPMCSTQNCLDIEQQRSLWLQVHSVAYGAVLLLITNLVAVGWITAMRGGRIDVAKLRTTDMSGAGDATPPASRVESVRMLLVLSLAATVVVYGATLPAYLSTSPVSGVVMFAVAALQLLLAALLLILPGRPAAIATAMVTGTLVALWLLSSTTGLPLGLGVAQPEAVGPALLATSLLETVSLILALVLLREWAWLRRPDGFSDHARWMAAFAVVALTMLGLAGSGLPGLGNYGNTGDKPLTATSTHNHSGGATESVPPLNG